MFHLFEDTSSDHISSSCWADSSQSENQFSQLNSNFNLFPNSDPNNELYDNVNSNIQEEIPPRTNWKIESSCCCYFCHSCSIDPFQSFNQLISPCISIQVNNHKREFWGFLELDLFGPIFVLFLIILGNFVFANTVLRFIKHEYSERFFILEVVITCVIDSMLLWAFYSASWKDPGFLPYDWKSSIPTAPNDQMNCNEKISIPKFGWRAQLSGLAVNADQIEYAKRNRPPFASFSQTAGRYIIRADHICAWTGNWVGKRNHKQFILSAFWAILMLSHFIYLHSWCVFRIEKENNQFKALSVNRDYIYFLGPIYTVLQFLAIMIESAFLFALFCMFFDIFIDILKGTTKIQNWKMKRNNIKIPNRKWIDLSQCMRNLREVCGNSFVLCWFIPFDAFNDVLVLTEDELLPQSQPIMY